MVSTIWFTADTHFGHARILEFYRREFASVEQMDEHLLDQINRHVQPQDRFYHLGDFLLGGDYRNRAQRYLSRIRCKEVHITPGNHDRRSLGDYVRSYRSIKRITYRGCVFVLCHYPLASWPQRQYGAFHLYGHCHGQMESQLEAAFPNRRALDVGLDAIYARVGEYRPVSVDEIIAWLGDRPIPARG